MFTIFTVMTAIAAAIIPRYALSSSFLNTFFHSFNRRRNYRLKLIPNRIINTVITPSIYALS